jgi:hypothetical protein
MDNNKFVVKFPNHEMLERVLGFEEFTLKGTGLSVSVNKWGAASLAKAKLFSVWVKINGIPDDLVHYKGICEAASPLGVVQEIDTPAMIKFKLARVKVGVRDPSLIPPSTEITTDPYIYDAFYEVEEVVEQDGLLDEDGVIIPGISDSHVVNNAEDSPSKRARVEDHEKSGATKEGVFFTKEELNNYIMEETEKRMEQHVLKMEERILASQLQFNMQTRQELKSKIDRVVKENLNWSEDYGQGCTGDEKFNEENEMCEESSPSVSQKATDILKECEAEAQKQMMKEKAAKAMEDDNIRLRLRPQNDAKMMDKAKDLASKKNLETKVTPFLLWLIQILFCLLI